MKNFDFKKIIPHVAAIVIFLLVAYLYCKPAFEGQVVQQSDTMHWKAMARDGELYAEKHGQPPLWNKTLFGGMPTFQIAYPSNNNVPWFFAQTLFTLGLPIPASMFFTACLMFYFLGIVLRVNPWISIIGAIGYSYCTFDPIIIGAGHNTQMWAIAFLPAALASLLLIFKKHYWIGLALTTLFTAILIDMNHLQITYYFLLIVVIMTIAYAIKWIRGKEYTHMIKTAALSIVAAGIGVAVNAVILLPTYDYKEASIRGQGPLKLGNDSTKQKPTVTGTGIDWDYATNYSYGKMETFTLLIPSFRGGGSARQPIENSEFVQALTSKNVPEQQAYNVLMSSLYWGPQPGTNGPVYIGAVICFLFIAGLFFAPGEYKWWIIAASLFGIILSWGNNFEAVNKFFFNHLPMFNNFRASTMALVIPQLLMPLLGILGLQQILFGDESEKRSAKFKKVLITTGAVLTFCAVLYVGSDFGSERKITDDKGKSVTVDQQMKQNFTQALGGNEQDAASLISKIKDDRKSLYGGDLVRSFLLIAFAAGLLFLVVRKKIKPVIAIAGLLVLTSFDNIGEANKYLNSNNYLEPEENNAIFNPTTADLQILQDKSDYRVFNLSDPNNGPFNDAVTSYHHRSTGGYHAAKLRIYQDLIENQISKNNQAVLDMMNTKYIIQQTQGGQYQAFVRGSQLGSAWFVKYVQFLDGDANIMRAMDHFNPRDTALVDNSFKAVIPSQPVYDSTAKIDLVANDNDLVTYKSSSATNQFAVFSEIYYKNGWKAYVDNKETPIVRVNYVLRGLSLPAGNHDIQFKFLPESFEKGRNITKYSQIILLLLLVFGLFMEWRDSRKKSSVAA